MTSTELCMHNAEIVFKSFEKIFSMTSIFNYRKYNIDIVVTGFKDTDFEFPIEFKTSYSIENVLNSVDKRQAHIYRERKRFISHLDSLCEFIKYDALFFFEEKYRDGLNFPIRFEDVDFSKGYPVIYFGMGW